MIGPQTGRVLLWASLELRAGGRAGGNVRGPDDGAGARTIGVASPVPHGFFAGVAILLGLVAVYGVLSYLVGQRRQEIAVRLALGATRSEILRLVASHGVVLGSVGVGLGLAASTALSRVLEGRLFGVSALDPGIYALTAVLHLVVIVAASALPAWRATRAEALAALRGE